MPSTNSIELSINIPPTNCKIQIMNNEIVALTSQVELSVNGCIDSNKPLKYQFVLYLNKLELDQDYSQGIINNGLILQEFDHNFKLSTVLNGNTSSILMVSIKDSLDGITNITQPLNITSNILTSQEQINLTNSNNDTAIQLRNIMLLLFDLEIDGVISSDVVKHINSTLQQLVQCCYKQYEHRIDRITMKLNKYNILESSEITNQLEQLETKMKDMLMEKSESFSQFELVLKQQQWFSYGNLLSSLYSGIQSQQNYSSENTEKLLNCIHTLCQIILNKQVINQNKQIIDTQEFQIEVAKFTTKLLEEQIGSILQETHFMQYEGKHRVLDEQSSVYDYRFSIFPKNPYSKQPAFRKIDNGSEAVLYYPNITKTNEQTQISIQQPIQFAFALPEQNVQNYVCTSYVEDNWDTESCLLNSISGQTSLCACKALSPITLLYSILKFSNQVSNLFTMNTLDSISNYPYHQAIFTYVILIFTIAYISMIFYGKSLDRRQSQTRSQTKIFPHELISEKAHFDNRQYINNNDDVSIKKYKQVELENDIHNQDIAGHFPQQQSSNQISNQFEMTSDRIIRINTILNRKMSRHQSTNPIIMIKVKQEQNIDGEKKDDEENSPQENSPEENSPQDNNSPQRTYRTIDSPDIQHIKIQSRSDNQIIHEKEECNGIYQQIQANQITQLQGWLLFTKNFHQILELHYRYNEQSNRIHRSTILYVSLLGQMSILCFLGEILDISTILALSILQSLFGAVYKLMIFYLIHSGSKVVNLFGANVILFSTLLFIFVILGSISNYESIWIANLWGMSYIGSFILDYCVYRVITLYIVFKLLIKYAKRTYVKRALLLFLEAGTSEIFYGTKLDLQEGKVI